MRIVGNVMNTIITIIGGFFMWGFLTEGIWYELDLDMNWTAAIVGLFMVKELIGRIYRIWKKEEEDK